jgi:Polysaccharide pyruvyl transferase
MSNSKSDRRVGLIDNLVDIDSFISSQLHAASAKEIMTATGGNTGNAGFVFGTRKILGNRITRAGWGWNPKVIQERFDHLVICCANQLGSHADLGTWADRLEQFNLPVTLFGLGAQSDNYDKKPKLPDGTMRFLRLVETLKSDATSSNIGVRGQFTQSVLSDLGIESSRTGCPSLMISKDRNWQADLAGSNIAMDKIKVAVAAGNPWHGPSAFLEPLLVEIVDNHRGAYVLQHPEVMFQIALGETETIPPKTIERFLEVYNTGGNFESLVNWYRHNAHFFVEAPNWMRFLRTFDMVIGPRYHGVALGIQAGIPGCVFTIDSRTAELCEETAIKNIPTTLLKGLTDDEVVEASSWTTDDINAFVENRAEKAIVFSDFISSNNLTPSVHLNEQKRPII